MSANIQLPPREKKLIVRKPDSKYSAEKRKLSSKSHTDGLNISFVSLRDASPTDTHHLQRIDSKQSLSLSRTRKLQLQHLDTTTVVKQQNPASFQTPKHKKPSFNIKEVENTIDNLSEIKLYNDYSKLNSEKQFLYEENRRLKKQISDLVKQKQANGTRKQEQYLRVKRQNKELECQCLTLGRTIAELEGKLKRKEEEYCSVKNLLDAASLEVEYLTSELETASSLTNCYQETINNIKIQNNRMSEEIRYLNISLTLKARKEIEVKAIERDNDRLEDLKRKNKRLHKENNSLRRNRVGEDELVELTPEKNE